MGKSWASTLKALLLLHLQLFAIIHTSLANITITSPIENQQQPLTNQVIKTSPEGQIVIQTSLVSSPNLPPNINRTPGKPKFQVTQQRYRTDPYTILKPIQEAQDRIFEELVTAATIVPKLFGYSDKPFWVPHKYFNLCPMVDPNSDTLWAQGCQGFPYQVSEGQQIPWAAQKPAAGASASGGTSTGNGWGGAPVASGSPFAPLLYPFSLVNTGPNNILGYPPGIFPSIYPHLQNPNPSMPPPSYPQFVNNNEATEVDMTSLFASSGPSSGSSVSSFFFNSPGGGSISNSNGNINSAQVLSGASAGPGNQFNGMALYSGGYGGGGGAPLPMAPAPYPFPYAMAIVPVPFGGPGYGWPTTAGGGYDWNNGYPSKNGYPDKSNSNSYASSTSGSSSSSRENRKEKETDETAAAESDED